MHKEVIVPRDRHARQRLHHRVAEEEIRRAAVVLRHVRMHVHQALQAIVQQQQVQLVVTNRRFQHQTIAVQAQRRRVALQVP